MKYQVCTFEYNEAIDATDGEKFDSYAEAEEHQQLLIDGGWIGQESFIRNAPSRKGETREHRDERLVGC